jgi:c-di-GMP-binding flagellar brake protein YcgR
MESIVLFITVLLVLLSLLAIIFITMMYKRMRKMKGEIQSLKNDLKNSHNRTNVKIIDRRGFHRINVNHVDCYIVFKDFGTEKLNKLVEKYIDGEIDDISVGGMKLLTSYDLPVHYHIVGQLIFKLKDEEFNLMGEFVRKESKVESTQFIYGIKFINLNKQDEHRLGKVINEIELEKRKI